MFTPTRAVQQRVSERRTSECIASFKLLPFTRQRASLSPTHSNILLAEMQGLIQGLRKLFIMNISLCPIALIVVYTNFLTSKVGESQHSADLRSVERRRRT